MKGIKEEVRKLVKECVYVGELSSEKISDKILSLIQSHLVKEITEKIDAKYDDGNEKIHPEKAYFECKQDIIKIINAL